MKVHDLFQPDETTKGLLRTIVLSADYFRRSDDDAEPEESSAKYEFYTEPDDRMIELLGKIIASGDYSWEPCDAPQSDSSSAVTGPMLDRQDQLAEDAGTGRSQLIRRLRFTDFVINVYPPASLSDADVPEIARTTPIPNLGAPEPC